MARKKKSKIDHKQLVVILSATTILFLALAMFLFLKPADDSIAGKAFHAEGAIPSFVGEIDAQLSFDQGFAAEGDNVNVNLKIKSPHQVSRVSFQLNYNQDCLTPSGDPNPSSTLTFITQPTEDDPIWSFSTTGSGPTGEFTVVSQSFTVNAGVEIGTNCNVNFIVTDIIKQEGKEKINQDDIDRTSAITIAPVCNENNLDLDNDGFGKIPNPNPHGGLILKACDYPDVEDCNDDCNNCHPAYPGSLGIQAISAGTEICDNQDNDCNDDTGDGSGEQAPLNSKQQGICFETTKSCGDDCELGGDCWQDNFPEEYSLEEQCDFIDHDCDGKPNTQTNGDNEETVLDGCQIGGSSGLPFDAGNLYVDNWVPGEGGAQIPDEGNLPTNYIDATIVSIQQELYETGNNNGGLPLCHNFGAGKICVCKNGDYWRDENGNGNVDYVVNYVGRTKEVSAFIIGGNVLKNGDENVQCPLE